MCFTFLVATWIVSIGYFTSVPCLNLNNCHHHRCLGSAVEALPRDSSTHKEDKFYASSIEVVIWLLTINIFTFLVATYKVYYILQISIMPKSESSSSLVSAGAAEQFPRDSSTHNEDKFLGVFNRDVRWLLNHACL